MTVHTFPKELQAGAGEVALRIEGMTCASCVGHVEKALKAVPGVAEASVNLATERAQVSLTAPVGSDALARAVEKAGYRVAETTTELAVHGMTCASCVGHVEKALKAVPGVIDAAVNLATEKATVRHLDGAVAPAALIAAVNAAGYRAEAASSGAALDSGEAAREAERLALRNSLGLAALLTLPVFALEMGSHLIPGVHHWVAMTIGTRTSWLIQFVLTSLVLFGPGLRFFRKGVPSILRRAPDMNALVAIGASAAWGYSVVALFAPQVLPEAARNVYFEAAAVIVTLILLGKYLEARAKGRTSEAIQKLMGLQPKTARVLRDGEAVETPLEAVVSGDLLLVRPGDKIAVDGEVVEGSSFVDEAMISGEPVPVRRDVGQPVIGGTINKSGSFTFRATKVGSDTVLAQIIRMVESAQGAKLPIQAVVDKVTAWFVPAVMAVAALTAVAWLVFGPEPALTYALVAAVSVLIIACPCAMGLATPTSIMVGTGRAAELGVLFRKGEALQALKAVSVVALDKTGTLTKGRPELTDLRTAPGFERAEVLGLVGAVETRSEHPIAEAIVAAAQAEQVAFPPVERFEAEAGFGVSAVAGGRKVEVGADRLMTRLGHDLSVFSAEAERLGDGGKSPLYAAIDGRLAAILAVADPIKETTPAAIEALHAIGLKVAMITGDNRRTAQAVARQLGIDEVEAEVLPAGKVEAVKRLKASGRRVAFVGDGVNDAPALAEADVGLAIGTGTDIAIESADVVLMSGDLRGVPNAVALSKSVMSNIRQNLFWAFGYNVALIPVAAGVLYPSTGLLLSPVFAAGAMAASSVFVLGNALRLRLFKPPLQAKAPRQAAPARIGAPATA